MSGQVSIPYSGLNITHPWPILQRFSQMRLGDRLAAGQVRDGARQLEDAVIGAGGELELVHGSAHQASAGFIE
jgi:hypothetical protein